MRKKLYFFSVLILLAIPFCVIKQSNNEITLEQMVDRFIIPVSGLNKEKYSDSIFNENFQIDNMHINEKISKEEDIKIEKYEKGMKVVVRNNLVVGLVIYSKDLTSGNSIDYEDSGFITDYNYLTSEYGSPKVYEIEKYSKQFNRHFLWNAENKYYLIGMTNQENIYYVAVCSDLVKLE
jgi:hypothetical protein